MLITAQMVKELRECTGAGIIECKKALTLTNGNIEKAIDNVRKLGQTKAYQKSYRTTTEGAIAIARSKNKITMIEVNSETDFVARDNHFKNFINELLQRILNSNAKTVDEARALTLER